MFYVDTSLVIDLDFLVAAHPGQGSGEHDGQYWICLFVESGPKVKRLFADYATREARDTAFAEIGRLLQLPRVPYLDLAEEEE